MTACAVVYDTAPTAAAAAVVEAAYRLVCSENRFMNLAQGKPWAIQVEVDPGAPRLLLSSFFPPALRPSFALALSQAREAALLAQESAAVVPIHRSENTKDPFEFNEPDSWAVSGAGPVQVFSNSNEAEAECVRRCGFVGESSLEHGRQVMEALSKEKYGDERYKKADEL